MRRPEDVLPGEKHQTHLQLIGCISSSGTSPKTIEVNMDSNSNNHQQTPTEKADKDIQEVRICNGEPITKRDKDIIKAYIALKYPSLAENPSDLDGVIELLSEKDPATAHKNDAVIEECVTGFIAYEELKDKFKDAATFQGINRPTSGSVDFIVTFTLNEDTKKNFIKKIPKLYTEASVASVNEYLNGKFKFGIDPFGSPSSKNDKPIDKDEYLAALQKHTNNIKREETLGFQTVGVAHTDIKCNDIFNSPYFAARIKEIRDPKDKDGNPIDNDFNLVSILNIDDLNIDEPRYKCTIDCKKDIIEETVLNPARIRYDIGKKDPFEGMFEEHENDSV
ncbi:hypothetical protein OD808_02355 [Aeromonas veronii]|uniref:hypothetical protein n=1 Tax=Aeromonas veronii TaxID=654 RepID=UPI0022465272|nr:hypothetical protein [Aeromonas veronii]MCX0429715.1 hypothetical protein [Aeromonas veronii]